MLSNRYTVFIPLIMFVCTAGLYGDGCFVWNKGADLNEPMQKAIIYWKDGREVLLLQVKYEGPAEDFAWIVPLPSKPKVAAIDAEKSPFAEISLYTQYRIRWGLKGRAGVDAEEAVTVLERKIVGVYDIAVLAASDAAALNTWLNNNGYAFPKKRKDVLEHYTKKKWVYVAMRIDRKALESDEVKKLKVGELQPIRFTFAAKKMVYPLKISSINAGETEVLLYVLADAPMVVKSKHMRAGLSIEENIPYAIHIYSKRYWDAEYGTFRKVAGEELPLTWEALGVPKDKELSLCRYRAVYKVEEMADDLVFTRFEPMTYWKEQFHKQRKKSYLDEREKVFALTVLAYHDADLLRKLARNKDKHARELVALCPKTPKQLLSELAKDEDYSVKFKLARREKMHRDILSELANDENADIRREVASNSNTSVDTLYKLARDKEARVRVSVVHNSNTPKDLLKELAQDENQVVRAVVAYHWRIPLRILRKLAKDKISEVRRNVISNPNMPEELLEQLAGDDSPQVRTAVAERSRTKVKTLRKLSTDNSHTVRRAVALNLNTPVDILVKLAKDKNFWVREAIAYNPNTPLETLKELTKDNDANVSKAARLALARRGL